MAILVQIEHANGVVTDASHELIALAKTLGDAVEALVCAGDEAAVAALAGQLDADIAVGIADAALAEYLPSAYLTSLNAAIAARAPELVLMSYSTAGIDLAAGAAIASDRELVGYASALSREGDQLSVTSQVYGGKLLAETEVALPAIAAVMPGATKVDGPGSGAGSVEMMSVDLGDTGGMRLLETLVPDSGGVDLTKAERIVCVGRALGGTDKLPIAEDFAGKLGAEIAGSRPVIDAGWLPKSRQVGKSGTKVKPKLYFMAGVSGAPEHLEGMQESDLIIALNSDEAAPIFSKAHYGAVCDMFDLLPALSERLE